MINKVGRMNVFVMDHPLGEITINMTTTNLKLLNRTLDILSNILPDKKKRLTRLVRGVLSRYIRDESKKNQIDYFGEKLLRHTGGSFVIDAECMIIRCTACVHKQYKTEPSKLNNKSYNKWRAQNPMGEYPSQRKVLYTLSPKN